MNNPDHTSPFTKSNPLYRVATNQNFAGEHIQFKPVIDVLEMLFSNIAFGNYCLNVIDFRDFTYPYSSKASIQVIGYRPEDMKNLDSLTNIIHPDDLPVFVDYGAKVMSFISALPRERKHRAMINHCYRILHGIRKEYIWLYQQHHMSYLDTNDAIVYSITLSTDVTMLNTDRSRPSWSVTERMPDGTNVFLIGSEDAKTRKHGTPKLTVREREIISLSVRGYTSRDMARELGIAYETVITHKKRILQKTSSRNFSEAITFALNSGNL
jgi:DNA-binding CsgD family transcriptional regulator